MRYPRVTQILAPLYDSSYFTEEGCIRGTEVHAACASCAKELYYPLNPDYQGFCHSFNRWFDKFVVSVIYVEERFTDEKLGFTGKPDLVCNLTLYSGVTIVDIKTGTPMEKIWRMQKAAYAHLVESQEGCPIERAIDLILDPDGGVPKVWGDGDNISADLAVFLSQLNVFNYMRRE
jgi:hypothetical protein